MSVDGGEDGLKSGGKERLFIVASAAIFLAIAGCVVYFVYRIIV
jgi:hypothetical protein